MSFIDTLKKHISYQTADQVAEICAPLFKSFSINYFYYLRKYHSDSSNSTFTLFTHRDWMSHYIKNSYPILLPNIKVIPWESYIPQAAMKDGATYFNLHSGISITKTHKNFLEVIGIATSSSDNNLIEKFYNYREQINQFIFYFKDKANELIKKADKERLSYPKETVINSDNTSQRLLSPEFCAAVKTNQLRMNFDIDEIIFSQREFEVLSLIAAGHTMKHSAEILRISPRTVESHINNAKNKTRDFSTRQLIECFRENLF